MSGTLLLLALVVVAWSVWDRRTRGPSGADEVLLAAERAGIISEDQRRRILALETRPAPSFALSGVTWLAIAAGLFVLAGIALIIATNWERIGPLVRIVAYLLLLLGVGEAAVRARRRGPAAEVALQLVWLFFPLLGIGLYAQTFQLSGDETTPFLVWLALSAPLAWLGGHVLIAAVHTAALAVVLFAGGFGADGVLDLRGSPDAGAWLLSLAVLAAVVLQSLRLLPEGQRYYAFGVVAAWVLAVLLGNDALRLEDGGWVAVAAASLATLWVLAVLALRGEGGEIAAALVAWIAVLYGTTFAWHADDAFAGPTTAGGMLVTGVAMAGAVGGALLLPSERLGTRPPWTLVARVLLVLPIAVALCLTGGLPRVHAGALAANVLLVANAVVLMWHGSTRRAEGEINLGVAVLLAVLVTRFLDVFGTFAQSGVGFIVAGIVLAAVAWALERTRRRLIGATREPPR